MPAADQRVRGKVYLVGAGPGDPDLITVRARLTLERADSVLYDELANPRLLDWVPAAAERLYVGKRAHAHALRQEEITRWLIERAQRGWCVVRLKGGDPFVFGRGGEEALGLSRAGVEWEAIPGLTAGIAGPAAAGIPVTQRGVATSVRLLTGHALAAPERLRRAPQETLVVFMGLERLAEQMQAMIQAGEPGSTPAAVIQSATLPEQKVVIGCLADIAARVQAAGVGTPALLVIGEAIRLREQLGSPAPPGLGNEGALSSAVEPPRRGLPRGLIVLAHGSPLADWHASVDRLAYEVASGLSFCRAAYLDPAHPNLFEVAAEAHAAGVRELAVVPYFLAAGLHVSQDIPKLVEALRQRYPELRVEVSACLEGHAALRTAVLSRAGEAMNRF